MENNPIVFISYSQDSIAFSNKILEFSNRLRKEGIDAILDQYEESPPEGWPKWMDRSIKQSDYVLVVGSKGYYNKSYDNVEKEQGHGVKWESTIIYQHLYNDSSSSTKFIPVVFNDEDYDYLPIPLQGSTWYNVSTDEGYNRLYWRLRGKKEAIKPPLGELKPLPEKERKTLFFTSVIDLESWDKAIWRGAGFAFMEGSIPALLLLFSNEMSATKIFKDWKTFFGEYDKKEDIRVALIEGEVEGEESGYYIVVGTNLDEAIKRAEKSGLKVEELLIMNISRIIRADPSDDFRMYNYFKSEYLRIGAYYLVPAIVNEKSGTVKPLLEYKILKHSLIYRNISDISENDEDAILIKKAK